MRSFENSVRVNFNTEYQTVADNYTKQLKDFDKALKNATGGMGYEDALTLANQLGISLKAFRQESGKFFLDDLSLIKDKMMPAQDSLLAVLHQRS